MGLNKWEIYELLKGNTNYDCKDLFNSDIQQIVEGIQEYVSSKRDDTYDKYI